MGWFSDVVNRSTSKANSRVLYRNVREVSGTAVLYPDWLAASARRNDLAIVLHVDDPARIEQYQKVIADAEASADIFVLVPEGVEVPSDGFAEVLEADPIGDHLFQFTSLVNSDRLSGYRTVVRHVDSDAASFARFASLPLSSIDAVVHGDLDRAGVAVAGGSVLRTTADATYRADQLLRLASTRQRASSFDNAGRSLSTVALRGAIVALLRPLRIDHQDFFTKYFHMEHEGHAIQARAGGVVDQHAAAAVTTAFLSLIDATGLRIDDATSVEQSDAPVPGTPRAQAWALYHPDLTTQSATRNVTWSHLSASVAMYSGQHLPIAPTEFSNPLVAADRARATVQAAASGITGFLVTAEWSRAGLSPAPFFDSLASDTGFPWAILLQHSVTQRINPFGVLARQSPWVDPGVEHYPAITARMAALASSPSYLRLDGKPVVIVQDIMLLDDRAAFLANLREAFSATGVWIGVVERYVTSRPGGAIIPEDVDGVVQIPPGDAPMRRRLKLGGRFGGFHGAVVDVSGLAVGSDISVEAHKVERILPGAFVGYDTTPELRSQGTVGYNWNLATFRRQLDSAVRSVAWRDEKHRIVVINSWNGWADMSQLEPGYHRGDSYLSTVKDVLEF